MKYTLALFFLLSAAVLNAQTYTISTYAGGAPLLTPWPATNTPIRPQGLVRDTAGNVFFSSVNCVYRMDPRGVLTRVAGNSRAGYSGDGGLAVDAQLNNPEGVAADPQGNVYIGDDTYVFLQPVRPTHVRKVTPNGIIVDVPVGDLILNGASGVAVDASGNLFITDTGHYHIVKVSPDGSTALLAVATLASLITPYSLALDAAGNLFIADAGHRGQSALRPFVVKFTSGGTVSIIAGGGSYMSFEPPPAILLSSATAVAPDGNGGVLIADSGRILDVAPDGTVKTVAGADPVVTVGPVAPPLPGPTGDGGPAVQAQLQLSPNGSIALDPTGNLYIVEPSLNRVRKVSPHGTITTLPAPHLSSPAAVSTDAAGNVYILENGTTSIRKITPDGISSTVVNYGRAGYRADNMTAGANGNLFLADSEDYQNYAIFTVSPDGTITKVAGTSTLGFSPDGTPVLNAPLNSPRVFSVDAAGNLYFADNARVRKLSAAGIITTVAGNGKEGYSGDGGPALAAAVTGAAVADAAGNVFIADSANNRVRKVSTSGIITTIAGTGVPGYAGDGGPAATAQLRNPAGIAVDGAGNIYVSDLSNNAIRVLHPVNQQLLVGAVLDAAGERALPIAPGKIITIFGVGLDRPGNAVLVNGIAAPVIYSSSTQVVATVPDQVTGATATVAVGYLGITSSSVTLPLAGSSPALFTANQTGAGQAAAVNLDGTVNTAANPVKIGGFISLYGTGEGRTALPVSVTVDGQPAVLQYAGQAPQEVAGLLQINVQIPGGVKPGGYVPVLVRVGTALSPAGVTIAVTN